MEYANIQFQVKDGVATITFNRPQTLNALNSHLLKELSHALDSVADDEDVRVLILTGAGEKSFVAGADITELATFNALQAKRFAEQGHKLLDKMQSLPIPVIAAVNGFALGGGSEIALACDFIYASENAVFGLPEVTLGLIPGWGGTQRLAKLIPFGKAIEMILTGKRIDAREALNLNLVSSIVPIEKLMTSAKELAVQLCDSAPLAIRAVKEAVYRGYDIPLVEGLKLESDLSSKTMSTKDYAEGRAAFLEKRKPEYKGD